MVSMGLTQMTSLLTSANTMKYVTELDKNMGALQRNMKELGKEIASAKEAGVDTSVKEEKYSQMENSLNSITEDVFSTGKELSERIAEDNEKIHAEEAEQEGQAKKAADSKTETPTVAISGDTVNMEAVVSGITEPVDTVEISPEAKSLATERAEHKPAPQPTDQTPSPGKTLDKKV